MNVVRATESPLSVSCFENCPKNEGHQEREHLPPIRDLPEEVPKLDRDQIIIRPYIGGLAKSFERRAA